MTDSEVGQQEIRAQFFDKMIKGIAPRLYKFKQAVSIESTSAWKNFFYRENTAILTGADSNPIKGIPRGAEFPTANVDWERVQSVILKYGLEKTITWEDIISNEIDVQRRTMIKITEGVVKAVDDEIWDVLTESQAPSAIQSVTISSGFEWGTASAAIFDNIGACKRLLGVANYPTTGLMCFISPQGQQDIDNYIYEKGAQAPTVGAEALKNGSIGRINGVEFIVSNSVTASFALVVVPKRVATWKQLVGLSTDTVTRKFKDTTITAVEMGVTQLTDPLASVLIINTEAP